MAYDLIAGKQTPRNYSLGGVSDTSGSFTQEAVKKTPYLFITAGAFIAGLFAPMVSRTAGKHGVAGLAAGVGAAGLGYWGLTKSFRRTVLSESGSVLTDWGLPNTPKEAAVDAWGKKIGLNPKNLNLAVKEVSKGKFQIASRDDGTKRFAYGSVDMTDMKNPQIKVDADRPFKNPSETFYMFDKLMA